MDAIVAQPANSHEGIFVRKVLTSLTLVVNVRCSPAAHFASGV